jgi:hypothetical protein
MHAAVNRAGGGDVRCTHRRAEMLRREMRPRKARSDEPWPRKAGPGELWTGDTEAMRRHSRATMDRRRAAEDLHG